MSGSRAGMGVAVTGVGMVTPAGLDTGASWEALLGGASCARTVASLAGGPVDFACTVADGFDPVGLLGPAARRMDRFTQFAVVTAREAVADAGAGAHWDPQRVAVVLGTGFAGTTTWEHQGRRLREEGARFVSPLAVPRAIANMAAAQVCLDQEVHGPSQSVSTACASGTNAVATAMDLLRSGRCDVALAGGTEAAVTDLTMAAFHRLGALSTRNDRPARASRPFDRGRDGFVIGEGAAVLVLERVEDAAARGRIPYALLLGHGSTTDAHHLTSPDPDGRAAERAVRLALDDAGRLPQHVAHVNAHATSTPHGDATEARTLARLFPHHPPVTSVKGATGHLLAAAGALEAAITALTIHHGLIPPTANWEESEPGCEVNVAARTVKGPVPVAVTESFGFGGHNSALVLAAP
ncbi:3-oxoacyl-[acyl-carrier-protein] synthase II [Kitasatospora sp. SolWspMP-SS2h]|uniref:beta-ketoacyl-[acyl-carrier-protein] synthase family protein n=1 Tax=Kitasatospora sp. SolWspMP-SS2h TaxID=1305729 RepID=UPI000DB9552B|nr:beta-ketoacyl-[acyl-carrier-protein] synthase family protein [Kitasatospora sp. SolWspMP-SS2h]RAJ31281.1 3-oxoacyl-[acyl-carrier-protein] synthase II [Kitasatospora sp. SolWspMP-SS2h]